jgi:hypothetical protein
MKIAADLPRRFAALLLFGLLSAAIIVTARNEDQASGSPKKRSDIALQQAVTANMNAPQLRRFARDIALSDPMHAIGFFLEVMALDLDKATSMDNRHTLIAEASRRQPSFAAPRIWLTADDIRNERYPEAINGADTVMRLNGDFRTLLIPILVPLLNNDKAYPLLEAKLNGFPIWRTEFLVEAIKSDDSANRVETLLRQNPPSRYGAAMAIERSAYLRALVAKGEAQRAYALWKKFVPQQKSGAITDGDFKTRNTIPPFAWVFASDEYSYAEKVTTPESAEVVVRAHHSGDGKIALLSQLIGLQPGTHRFSITARDGGLAKPEAFFWRVRCADVAEPLASQSLGALGGDWQTVQMTVTIAEDDCALQTFSLEAVDNDGDEAEIEIRKVEAR